MTKQEIMKVIAADRILKQAYNTEPLFAEQVDYLGAREPISTTDQLKYIKHVCKQLDHAQQTIYVLPVGVPVDGYELFT